MDTPSVSPPRHLVSLGTSCHVAQFLKESGRKSGSTPFDWLFSTPKAVAHMLRDDFERFLDPAQYVNHRDEPDHPERAGHRLYHERMFNHRNPRRMVDYEYYCRCVERFRALQEHEGSILFVMAHMNQRGPVTRHAYEDVFTALRERTPNAALLAVHHVPDRAAATVTEVFACEGLRVVLLSGSRSDGRRFVSPDGDACFRKLVSDAERDL